jgi:flagellar secretion chaperone FliS
MLNNYQQLQAYQQASYNVGKGKQIVMLYDGMIRFVQQAKDLHEKGEIAEHFNVMQKLINVIMGLQSSLDLQNYPEISTALYDYYDMIYIKASNIMKHAEPLQYDELVAEIKQMRESWVLAEINQHDVAVAPDSVTKINDMFAPTEYLSTANEHGSFAINA